MMLFIQNVSLNFRSFLDIYPYGSGSSVDNNRSYCISTSYWVENLQLSLCFLLLKAIMNLNGIQRLSWDKNTWIINSRSSITFNLIHQYLIKCVYLENVVFFSQSYGSLSDNCFVIHASLYYRHLLVLALSVNFAFYQQ